MTLAHARFHSAIEPNARDEEVPLVPKRIVVIEVRLSLFSGYRNVGLICIAQRLEEVHVAPFFRRC